MLYATCVIATLWPGVRLFSRSISARSAAGSLFAALAAAGGWARDAAVRQQASATPARSNRFNVLRKVMVGLRVVAGSVTRSVAPAAAHEHTVGARILAAAQVICAPPAPHPGFVPCRS